MSSEKGNGSRKGVGKAGRKGLGRTIEVRWELESRNSVGRRSGKEN